MFSTVGTAARWTRGWAIGRRYDPASLASNPSSFRWASGARRGRVLWTVEKAGRFHRVTQVDEGLALYANKLGEVVFAPEGLLKLVFEKGSGGYSVSISSARTRAS